MRGSIGRIFLWGLFGVGRGFVGVLVSLLHRLCIWEVREEYEHKYEV